LPVFSGKVGLTKTKLMGRPPIAGEMMKLRLAVEKSPVKPMTAEPSRACAAAAPEVAFYYTNVQ
jgi:hypothetical protein